MLPGRRPSKHVRRVLVGTGLAVALMTAAWRLILASQSTHAAPLERYGPISEFALETQNGTPFTQADLRGQVSIANFIFTRCPTVCPVFTLKMRRLQDRSDDLGERLQLLSFSVDPQHDSPTVLRDYAQKNGADPERWTFLTGELATMRAVIEDGLKISMQRRGTLQDGVPDIVHGSHFVLIDREGEIRGYYNSEDQERIDALLVDARQLISESAW